VFNILVFLFVNVKRRTEVSELVLNIYIYIHASVEKIPWQWTYCKIQSTSSVVLPIHSYPANGLSNTRLNWEVTVQTNKQTNRRDGSSTDKIFAQSLRRYLERRKSHSLHVVRIQLILIPIVTCFVNARNQNISLHLYCPSRCVFNYVRGINSQTQHISYS
jgi:hypothetical protein